MEFVMTVNMDNAAFEDDPHELARILREAAATAGGLGAGSRMTLYDSNGATVGSWEIR